MIISLPFRELTSIIDLNMKGKTINLWKENFLSSRTRQRVPGVDIRRKKHWINLTSPKLKSFCSVKESERHAWAWVGGVAQWIGYLLRTCEDLSLNLQSLCKARCAPAILGPHPRLSSDTLACDHSHSHT